LGPEFWAMASGPSFPARLNGGIVITERVVVLLPSRVIERQDRETAAPRCVASSGNASQNHFGAAIRGTVLISGCAVKGRPSESRHYAQYVRAGTKSPERKRLCALHSLFRAITEDEAARRSACAFRRVEMSSTRHSNSPRNPCCSRKLEHRACVRLASSTAPAIASFRSFEDQQVARRSDH